MTDCPECRIVKLLLRAAAPWFLLWIVGCLGGALLGKVLA